MAFDIKTIFTLIIIINIVIGLILVIYRSIIGVKFSGIYLTYASGKILQAIGVGFLLYREELSHTICIVLTNVFLYYSFSLEFFTLSAFGSKKTKKKLILFLSLATLFSIIFAINVNHSLEFRNFITFLNFAVMALVAGITLISVKPKSKIKKASGIMLIVVFMVMIFRSLESLLSQYTEVLFLQFFTQTLTFMIYFILTFIFTISFIFLVKEKDGQQIVSNNNLIKDIIDNLPIGLEIFDDKGFCVKMNKSMRDILYLQNINEVVNKFNILTDPISKANGTNEYYQKAFNGKTLTRESTVDFGLVDNEFKTRKDKRIFRETIFPIFDIDHQISHVVTLIWDLTDIRNKEKELKLSQDKFKLVFESSPIGKALYSREGSVLLINKKVTSLFGYTIDEIPTVEEWINKAYPIPEVRERTKLRWEQYMKDKSDNKIVTGFETLITCKDGHKKHLELNYEDIGDLRITTFVDITERKAYIDKIQKIKELLAENERLFDMGAWEYNIETGEMFWSDGLYKIHDFDKNEDIDHITESLKCYSNEDRLKVEEAFTNCVNNGTSYSLVCLFTSKKGKKKWIKTITKPVYDKYQKINGVIGVVVDISEHIQTENKLKELNATKDKLFSIIGHDLRGPIGNLIQLSDLVIEQADDISPDELEEYIKLMKTSSEKSFELLNNLLDWSRMSIGNISIKKEKLTLFNCVDEIVAMFQPMIQNKNISLINSIPKDFVLKADEKMIQTVFRNLISNAIKYTSKGGTIELETLTENENTIISISDNGIGMSENEVENLFNTTEFYSKQGTHNEKGSGLGLKLCREFIELHNGNLRVKSELDKGTTFLVFIPNT